MSKLITAEPRYNEKLKRWILQVSRDGKRCSFYSTNPNQRKAKAECRKKAQEWLDDINQPEKIRLKDAWNEYLDYYDKNNKPTSYNQVKSRGAAHLKKLSLRKLSEIKKVEWQQIIFNAYENGARSKATLKGIATIIRSFCKWAATKGYIRDNDVPIYFDFPRAATVKEKRILQPAEIQRLFAPQDDSEWYIYAWRFLVVTGLRRGELCALRYGDFDGQYITIRESVSHEGLVTSGKTQNANRKILLTPLALEQIKQHRLQAPESRYIFCDLKGYRTSPRVLRNHWQVWREANNIQLTLHELRHTFISYSRLKTEISLEDLKNLYGHSSEMDTDRVYVHQIEKSPEEIRAEQAAQKENAKNINLVFENIIDSSNNSPEF